NRNFIATLLRAELVPRLSEAWPRSQSNGCGHEWSLPRRSGTRPKTMSGSKPNTLPRETFSSPLSASSSPACRADDHITGPMIHGANSSSRRPDSSLFDRFPDATAMISSKIFRPTTGSGTPSRITPQLMSMSSSMCRYIRLLVASLMDGTGLQPKTEPRPVVKQMTLQPPATRPVIETGSCPGVSMKTNPRVVMGSPYWNTSIMGVVPPLVTPPSDFSKTVVMPPALLPGAGLLSIASMPRQYHSHQR